MGNLFRKHLWNIWKHASPQLGISCIMSFNYVLCFICIGIIMIVTEPQSHSCPKTSATDFWLMTNATDFWLMTKNQHLRLDQLHRAYPSLHPFGVVHWVPVLLNIKTATGCESNRQLQLWTELAGTVVNNYQFNGIQGWAGQLCQIKCRAVI